MKETTDIEFASAAENAVEARSSLTANLLGEVVLLAHLLDQFELRLKPIDVFLFRDENFGEQVFRAVVAKIAAQLDPLI